jgi:DNA-3-methyladenine glycosylase II
VPKNSTKRQKVISTQLKPFPQISNEMIGANGSLDAALAHLRGCDPILASIIDRVGAFRMQYREPVFATLVRSIVFQQLHGKAATTIFNRLLEKCGGELTPDSILNLRTSQMRAVGLSKQKLTYIRDLARKARTGDLAFEHLPGLSDAEVIARLTQVKGIGVWTAHMFLMFALRRENVLPIGDLGIRAAMRRAYGMKVLPKPITMQRIAKSWHPYCSIASWYLWRSLDAPIEL